MNINHLDDILQSSFGLWLSSLFSAIKGWNPGINLEEQREIFFSLVKRLLDEGKVKFCPPNEFWREGYEVWDTESDTIVQYLKSHWPVNVTSENDIALTNYFYDMPAILWVAADGTLQGS
ncbi:DUF596 domain-containing protein [Bordetella sputigena]|uniref:hypothetical protein n=1 Tax=Bordetella sputigena TaxID=1416810 RepID=UPI0039F0CCFC